MTDPTSPPSPPGIFGLGNLNYVDFRNQGTEVLVSVDPGTGAATTIGSGLSGVGDLTVPVSPINPSSALEPVEFGSNLYFLAYGPSPPAPGPNYGHLTLFEADLETGSIVDSFNAVQGNLTLIGLARDSSNGALVGIAYNAASNSDFVVSIDPDTGKMTAIGGGYSGFRFTAFEGASPAAPDFVEPVAYFGDLYFIADTSSNQNTPTLFEANVSTGQFSTFSLSQGSLSLQGLAFDPVSDNLVGIAYNSQSKLEYLVSVNPTTGQMTTIGSGYSGIKDGEYSLSPGAPALVNPVAYDGDLYFQAYPPAPPPNDAGPLSLYEVNVDNSNVPKGQFTSLAASEGSTPVLQGLSMEPLPPGIDYRYSSTIDPLFPAGNSSQVESNFDFVGEYLGAGGTGQYGYLNRAKADMYAAAQLQIFSFYENGDMGQANGVNYFSDDSPFNGLTPSSKLANPMARGIADGTAAYKDAISSGQTSGAIYFAVDFDPGTSTTVLNGIAQYFQGVKQGFNNASNNNPQLQIGVYGAGITLSTIKDLDHLATYGMLAESTGWTGTSTYTDWNLKQELLDDIDDQVTPDPTINTDLFPNSGPAALANISYIAGDETDGASFGGWDPLILSTALTTPEPQTMTGQGPTDTLVLTGSQTGSSSYTLAAAGGNDVVSNTGTGQSVATFNAFGTATFYSVATLAIWSLAGTSLSQGTVLYNGPDGGGTVDASSANVDLVASLGSGNSSIVGGSGNNTISDVGGNNTLNGGVGGMNTLDYSAAPAEVSVDLATGTAQNGYGGTDAISNFQVVNGSTYGGTFVGGPTSATYNVDGGANSITAGSGSVTVGFSDIRSDYLISDYSGMQIVVSEPSNAGEFATVAGATGLQFADMTTPTAFEPAAAANGVLSGNLWVIGLGSLMGTSPGPDLPPPALSGPAFGSSGSGISDDEPATEISDVTLFAQVVQFSTAGTSAPSASTPPSPPPTVALASVAAHGPG